MNKGIILFMLMSAICIFFSLHVLVKPKSHGFYRFFGWECLAWLFSCNYHYWFVNPFTAFQTLSWILLIYSLYLAIFGVILIKIKGKAHNSRKDDTLYAFEKTTVLITSGIYRYIRHPLYASLFFLAWGICLKNITPVLLTVCIASSIFFIITMLIEEMENTRYFGESYRVYMKKSRMIIPYVL